MKIVYSMILMLFSTSLLWAGEAILTPNIYIDVEIAVRSITLEQLRERVSGEETGINYKQRIQEKYHYYAVSAGEHVRYANDHQAEIDAWLMVHPDKQLQLYNLNQEFNQLIQMTE